MARFRLGAQNSRSSRYPKFSEAEFTRREERVRDWMAERDLDCLVVYGDCGFHQARSAYLTNYRPAFSSYLAFFADPAEESTLFCEISNRLQFIREASVVDDIRQMLPEPAQSVVERIQEAGVQGRIGLVGSDPRYDLLVPSYHYDTFAADLPGELVDVTAGYTRLISAAGEEELDRLREAGTVLDTLMAAFEDALDPGITEQGLETVLQETARANGATLDTNFITGAPMEGAEPGAAITWHLPTSRPVERGDVVTTEISAGVKGYASQIHRPYAVGDEPDDVYTELFDVAGTAYEEIVDALQPGNNAHDVAAAMEPIESSRFKIYDVVVHGYGGGYGHPFIGVEESNYWPAIDDPLTADWAFEPGNIIVVQPNVVTRDERACLQFGTTVIVGEDGPEIVHEYPEEFIRV